MIIQAAIRQDGIIYTGKRHCNIIYDMVENHKLPIPINGEQGFIDEHGKFFNRLEAGEEALECKQIENLKWPPLLYSEDLY